jgi:hypothetical protein
VPEMIDRDQEHLRILTMCYYLLAACTGFFSLLALLYVGFAAIALSGVVAANQSSNADPRAIGYIFAAFGIAGFLFGMGMALLYYLVARGLRDHRWSTFCYAMAAISCLYIPFGTAIGVCTILVLNRPDVKRLFSLAHPVPETSI